MMHLYKAKFVTLLGFFFGSWLYAAAQAQAPTTHHFLDSSDLAVTWSPERAKVANSSCSCFWLEGVSGNAALNFYHGLGLAIDLTYGTASNIQPNVNLSKFTYAFGPRYTWNLASWKAAKNSWISGGHAPRIFSQALFGNAHAYNSVFPAAGGSTTTADSISMQFGGGIDVPLVRGFGLRAAELDYVRTTFPNNYANSQNDFRASIGLNYHVQVRHK